MIRARPVPAARRRACSGPGAGRSPQPDGRGRQVRGPWTRASFCLYSAEMSIGVVELDSGRTLDAEAALEQVMRSARRCPAMEELLEHLQRLSRDGQPVWL